MNERKESIQGVIDDSFKSAECLVVTSTHAIPEPQTRIKRISEVVKIDNRGEYTSGRDPEHEWQDNHLP